MVTEFVLSVGTRHSQANFTWPKADLHRLAEILLLGNRKSSAGLKLLPKIDDGGSFSHHGGPFMSSRGRTQAGLLGKSGVLGVAAKSNFSACNSRSGLLPSLAFSLGSLV